MAACSLSAAIVTDDMEPLILRRGPKVRGDRVELRLRGPRSARGKMLGSLLELDLAHSIRRVHEVQFVHRVGGLEQLAEPCSLRSGIPRKVEDDRDTLRQEASYVRRQRVLQARRVFDEPRDVGDLAWKQVIEEFVLNQENGVLSLRQLSRERGLSGRHLAA